MNNRFSPFIPLFISLAVFAAAGVFIFGPQFFQEKVLENGLPGTAVILDIAPTGVIVNDQPRCKLDLKVTTAAGEVYDTTIYMIISPVYLPQFQPGAKLMIKYDPQDKKKVAVESVVRKELK